MGDCLQMGKPAQHVAVTEVDSAFCPLWDSKNSISFWSE